MRDSYTYAMQSPDENKFYTNATFETIVREFLDNGYLLFFSPDMGDYKKGLTFTIEKQLEKFEDITR
jgi:hypothetical protein